LDESTLAQAVKILLEEVTPRTSPHRATKEYRFELLPALLRDVLTRAAVPEE
jgi:CO/xanthine dehydrogenase FAD-binding subunit